MPPQPGELQSPHFSGEQIGEDTSHPPPMRRRIRARIQPAMKTFYQRWLLQPGRRIQGWVRAHPYLTLGIFLSLLLLPLLSALMARSAVRSTLTCFFVVSHNVPCIADDGAVCPIHPVFRFALAHHCGSAPGGDCQSAYAWRTRGGGTSRQGATSRRAPRVWFVY